MNNKQQIAALENARDDIGTICSDYNVDSSKSQWYDAAAAAAEVLASVEDAISELIEEGYDDCRALTYAHKMIDTEQLDASLMALYWCFVVTIKAVK